MPEPTAVVGTGTAATGITNRSKGRVAPWNPGR
ncbi:hypothetical protein C1S80_02010 [Mycolicibacterium aubagnense]|nr:hypothetical protein C1S80_02010 [Mycolicibacterium aubagnense]